MTTLRQQTDAQIEKTRQSKPEFMAQVEQTIEQAKREYAQLALGAGSTAPDFTLANATGELINLYELLEQGAVVLSFYRGSWCPYCNLQLRALQQRLADIHQLDAQLVLVSPQQADNSLSEQQKNDLSFQVLSDQDARIASQYGIAWQVPQLLLDHMRDDRGLDLVKINNGNGTVLPIPATFIINRHGEIVWHYIDLDYRKRAEPQDIIEALQQLA